MDKLEKALEKARKLRASQKPRTDVTRAVYASPGISPTAVTLDEAQLDRNHIIAYHTRHTDADIFRMLRTRVLQAMSAQDFKTLAITSPNYGDGKTTIGLNLAISIALDLKQTVLLVDLDLRKPSVHTYLDIAPPYGLTDHILDQVPIGQCLVRLPFERLAILPAGKLHDTSSEMLGSPDMAALAEELKSRYPDRYIIYDMPPILAQDDSLAFLPHVDATLLVVRDGVSKTYDIKRCMDALSKATIIGTVLNNRT